MYVDTCEWTKLVENDHRSPIKCQLSPLQSALEFSKHLTVTVCGEKSVKEKAFLIVYQIVTLNSA